MTILRTVALKFWATLSDDACMTHRSPSRWLAYGVASTLVSVLAIGVPLYAQEGPAQVTVLQATAGRGEVVPVAFAGPTEVPSPVEPSPEALVDIAAPEAAPPEALVEPAEQPPAPSPCADALAWVGEAGLPLPPGVGYHCPSTQFAHHGAACWNGSPCPGTGFIAINMDLMQGTSTDYLRHVVAHEVCHILEFQATGWTTEASADACAAAHGAP